VAAILTLIALSNSVRRTFAFHKLDGSLPPGDVNAGPAGASEPLLRKQKKKEAS